jgi:hypothetical protein
MKPSSELAFGLSPQFWWFHLHCIHNSRNIRNNHNNIRSQTLVDDAKWIGKWGRTFGLICWWPFGKLADLEWRKGSGGFGYLWRMISHEHGVNIVI